MNIATNDSKIETLYQYLRQVGIDGKEADSLITQDFRLVKKNNWLIRATHWLAAKLWLFDPTAEPTYIPTVIDSLTCYIREAPHENLQSRQHAAFVRAALGNILTKRDPHLNRLKELNLRPNPHVEALYVQAPSQGYVAPPRLPVDAISLILSHLPPKEVVGLSRVSKTFKTAARSHWCWQQLMQKPANHTLRGLFASDEPFPYALEANARVASNIARGRIVSTPLGEVRGQLYSKILAAGDGFILLHEIAQGRLLHLCGSERRVLPNKSELEMAVSGNRLFSVDPTAIHERNLQTGALVTYDLAEPLHQTTRVSAQGNMIFIYIRLRNRLLQFDTGTKTLTEAARTHPDMAQELFGNILIDRESGEYDIAYRDLLRPELGQKTLPNTAHSRTLLVKNQIACVLRIATHFDFYDLNTNVHLLTIPGWFFGIKSVHIEEGIFYLHYNHFGSKILCWDLVNNRRLGILFENRQVQSVFVHKRTLYLMSPGQTLEKADCLIPQTRAFSLCDLAPPDETVRSVGMTALFCAGSVATSLLFDLILPDDLFSSNL